MDNKIIKPVETGSVETLTETAPTEEEKNLMEEAKVILAGEDRVAKQTEVLQDIENLKSSDETSPEKIKEAGRERLRGYVNQALDILIDDVQKQYEAKGEPGFFAKVIGLNTKQEMSGCLNTLIGLKTKFGDSAVAAFDSIT
ncbi:MAG: hypothetical protein NTX66_04605 [Candidatus Falkowbacteria bacterium]|nr:hypothetical protein [Candidatus Falkowbacteria bacterium]